MSTTRDSATTWIAVIGDRNVGFEAQETIGPAVEHAASALGVAAPTVHWIATDALAQRGAAPLHGASAVWCAPGGPYRSMDGALVGIRWARERNVPFIGTCAGFQHGVIEFARNVLGHHHAAHAEYGTADADAEYFIDELLCSLVGETMPLALVDDHLVEIYGARTAVERYYCRFGLQPQWRDAVHDAGLRVVGVDDSDGDVRILRLETHPFFVLTLFVPQNSSRADAPHPLLVRFVAAASELAQGDRPAGGAELDRPVAAVPERSLDAAAGDVELGEV